MQKCKVSTLIILRTRMTTSICSEAEMLRNIYGNQKLKKAIVKEKSQVDKGRQTDVVKT